jgi:hypothetical protein
VEQGPVPVAGVIDVDLEEERKPRRKQEPVRDADRPIEHITQDEPVSTSETLPNQKETPGSKPNQEEVGFFRAVWAHLKRATAWRINKMEPLPQEAKVLDLNDVSNDILVPYLVWRRSVLLLSLLPTFLSAVLAWVNLSSYYSTEKEIFNTLGDILRFIPSASSTVNFFVIIIVLSRWNNWRFTARLFKIGWALSFLLPFLPAIFPTSFLLESCEELWGSEDPGCNDGSFESAVTIVAAQYALGYAFQLFPILISFPSGLSRASLKIRGLLPESTLSCWILVITAPFKSVIYLMALIVLIQLSGNIWLFLASILLFFAPWIYVIRRNVYLGVPTEEREKQLDRTQLIIGLSVKLALILFLVYLFTGDLNGVRLLGSGEQYTDYDDGTGVTVTVANYIFAYSSVIRVILESLGRMFVTTVLFSDVLFRMTVTNWRQDKDRRKAHNGRSIDDMFRSLEFSISSEKSREARSEDTDDDSEESNV